VGVTLNAVPLHVVVDIAFTDGIGFTFTVTVKELPVQVPDVGVTV
jgi:hypothetical protein